MNERGINSMVELGFGRVGRILFIWWWEQVERRLNVKPVFT